MSKYEVDLTYKVTQTVIIEAQNDRDAALIAKQEYGLYSAEADDDFSELDDVWVRDIVDDDEDVSNE